MQTFIILDIDLVVMYWHLSFLLECKSDCDDYILGETGRTDSRVIMYWHLSFLLECKSDCDDYILGETGRTDSRVIMYWQLSFLLECKSDYVNITEMDPTCYLMGSNTL